MSTDPVARRLRAAGIVLLAVAAFALFLALRPPDTAFPFDREGFVERWNQAVGDQALRIPEVRWTDRQAGVFGFAFTPTLSVLARAEGPFEMVAEVAVVGRPEVDGRELVVGAMEAVISVTEPELSAAGRAEVLARLDLAEGSGVDPQGDVVRGRTRFRAAADPERGVVGIGAAPASVGG